jgi:site-specific DNA-methyltransferase (adenine-specific)
MAVAIEDAGFEIRDQMMWLYGSGFPKSQNVGDGWGSALKPAHEPIVMARKQLSEKSIKENVLKHGTGAINIDGCRVEGNDAKYPDTNPDFRDQGKKSKEAIGIDKLSFGQVSGAERQKAVANSSGRFPANVMHDGSDVIVNQFPEGAKGSTAPRNRDTVGMFGMPNDATSEYADEGSAARFFYCPKTSKSERHSNLDDHETSVGANGNKWTDQDYRKGETKPTTERKNTHPTVKPVELMKYLCRLVTPKGGTVLDPFMGSGSTGMAAKDEGFDFIGIEKEKEYFEICESRINRFAPLMDFM